MQSENKFGENPLRAVSRVMILTLIFILIFSLYACSSGKGNVQNNTSSSSPAPSNSPGADLVITTSEISDTATFFPMDVDGTTLEVVAVKAQDGSIRTAFNTCQVCYDSGRGFYVQDGDFLVCQNCGNRFSMDQVEVQSGGCNPVPIFADDKIVSDDSITIPYSLLSKSRVIFENWRSVN